MTAPPRKILILGSGQSFHVGRHFLNAAQKLGLQSALVDVAAAYEGPLLLRIFNWHIRGHRPVGLKHLGRELLQRCAQFQPDILLTTGIAPVSADVLREIGRLGIRRINFLTDDPWNPLHRARWFFAALPHYDGVFSPRRANLQDLKIHACRSISYLPFAYAPEVHFRQEPTDGENFSADVVFIGGADHDRLVYARKLAARGFSLALYGGYWHKHQEVSSFWRGHADLETSRKAIAGAKLALCIVRTANRDGHSMRSFEVAAMGGCMLLQDTAEHREIFRSAGESVVYFSSIDELLERAFRLLSDEDRREAMSKGVREFVAANRHTYQDRLGTMLETA